MNIINTLTRLDPRNAIGDVIEKAVQGITGSDDLGKLAGLVVDLKTGNYLGMLLRGSDLVQNSSDFKLNLEIRFGPDAYIRICGRAADIAETCPEPQLGKSLDIDWGLGLIGWSISISVGNRPVSGEVNSPAETSPAFRSVLDDPGLCLEAKVALLFAGMIDELDGRIEDKLGQMENASRAREQSKAGGGDGESAGDDFNRISTEVQMLMQKRSQMYSLHSNMMSMFNDVSMQIINNVR